MSVVLQFALTKIPKIGLLVENRSLYAFLMFDIYQFSRKPQPVGAEQCAKKCAECGVIILLPWFGQMWQDSLTVSVFASGF